MKRPEFEAAEGEEAADKASNEETKKEDDELPKHAKFEIPKHDCINLVQTEKIIIGKECIIQKRRIS